MRPEDRPIGELVQDSVEHVREIFRNELRLAKVETWEEVSKAGRGAAMGVMAILFGVFTMHFLLWTLVWALAPEMENWLASLLVAIGTMVLAAIAGGMAYSQFKSVNPKPERATRQMKETVAWAKRQHF